MPQFQIHKTIYITSDDFCELLARFDNKLQNLNSKGRTFYIMEVLENNGIEFGNTDCYLHMQYLLDSLKSHYEEIELSHIYKELVEELDAINLVTRSLYIRILVP